MIKEIFLLGCLVAASMAMPAADYAVPAAVEQFEPDSPAIVLIQQENEDMEGAETAHHGYRGGYGYGHGGYGGGYGGGHGGYGYGHGGHGGYGGHGGWGGWGGYGGHRGYHYG